MKIVRVFSGWREAASFKRISEYFTGRENTGREAIHRSQPDQRSGYYFLVRTDNAGAPLSATATLHIITSARAQPREFKFPVELKSGDTVLNLGLTGVDWTDPKGNPVAWQLLFTDAQGNRLAGEASYLWERPTAK